MNNNKTLKIIICGGGTGGHLFPAIAIGDILKKYNHQIIFIGSKYGIEENNNWLCWENGSTSYTGSKRIFLDDRLSYRSDA